MGYAITSSGDHCYPNTTVLINRLGLTDQQELNQAEKIVVSVRAAEIETTAYDGNFTFSFYCELHKKLFGDLYDWAGQLRTVEISKKGTAFYPAKELASLGEALFQRLQEKKELRGLPQSEFAAQIAEFYHDLNMIHSFREGNGRTQRLFFTLLIRRAGYDISFADCDMDELMIATIYASQGVMDFLVDFFGKAIKS
jgi:cell filamentation protein